jgi:hypothetical protein
MDILASLREAFGQPTMTEPEALNRIQNLISNDRINKDNSTKINDLQSQLTAKNDELTKLKANLPEKLNEKVAAQYIDLACREMNVSASEGKCTPAQAKFLADSLKVDGKPNLNLVAADGSVFLPVKAIAEAFSLNKAVKMGEQTSVQTEDRKIPGETQPQGRILDKEAKNKLLEHVGLSI